MTQVGAGPVAAVFPNSERWQWNPTLALMNAAIERQGVSFVHPESDYIDKDWLRSNRGRADVIHLHWTQYQYLRSSLLSSVRTQAKFVLKLGLARSWGYRIVWTMHNVYPHERPYPLLDVVDRLVLARLSDAVVVHCAYAAEELRRRFRRTTAVYEVPLGHFVGVYPQQVTRNAARHRLGLPRGSHVLLFLGSLRPYKGLEHLISVFASTAADARLLIAGIATPEYGGHIQSLASSDSRILVRPELIPDEELQVYYAAADAVVLPFRRVLTSSSAIGAMSFRRPVIAPATGCLPELVDDRSGILYDPDDPRALSRALRAAMEADLDAMGGVAYDRALQFTWDRVGSVVAAAYRGE